MGARLRVFLTAEQDRTLYELRTATTVPQRVKDRASVLRLSSQGWYVEGCPTLDNLFVTLVLTRFRPTARLLRYEAERRQRSLQ